MKIAVTGATGYIGSHLSDLALNRGHDIVIASRKRPPSFASSWLAFDLLSDHSVTFPPGIDVVLHLAANVNQVNCLEEESEVLAAQRLIHSTQETGARFIFVSSQTARSDAPTAYGRIKWRIEQEVLSSGGWVVRPGQVYGGELRGLYGTLVNAVHHLPVLPAFLPAPQVQAIHVADLTEGLLRMAERRDLPAGVYCLAAPEPISFSSFLKEIAKSRLRCRRVFLPVPISIINAITIVLGKTIQTRLGLERLKSLFNLPIMETHSDLKQLDLKLRPLHSGMHSSGNARRRCLFWEGRAFLTFVLKDVPNSSLLRRYVRVIEQLRDGQALGLQQMFLTYPIFLSLLKASDWPNTKSGDEFAWRLDAATVLAEATPKGAYRFLELGPARGMVKRLLLITNGVISELFWRMLRVLLSPLVRIRLKRASEES